MAEPKKRTNNSKQGMRRMHDKVSTPAIVFCPNCHAPAKKHFVCGTCGEYRSKKILDVK